MKKNKILITIFLVGISCSAWSQQIVDDTKPMYGEVEKDERYKKIDDDFRKAMIKEFGSVDQAVKEYLNIAWNFFYRNDLETAMRRFNQAWLLNPDYPDAYFGFAALLEMQGKKAEASRFHLLGIEKDKEGQRTIDCLMQIADCKDQLSDLQGAIETISTLQMLKPDEPAVYRKLGQMYMKLEEFSIALVAYGKAIELNPNDAVSYHDRAFLHKKRNDFVLAMLDYDKSIRLDANYLSAYINRGIVEIQTGNFEAAKQDFQICVKLNPESGEIRRLLGVAKLNLEDRIGACEEFNLAKKLGDPAADEIINEFCK